MTAPWIHGAQSFYGMRDGAEKLQQKPVRNLRQNISEQRNVRTGTLCPERMICLYAKEKNLPGTGGRERKKGTDNKIPSRL